VDKTSSYQGMHNRIAMGQRTRSCGGIHISTHFSRWHFHGKSCCYPQSNCYWIENCLHHLFAQVRYSHQMTLALRVACTLVKSWRFELAVLDQIRLLPLGRCAQCKSRAEKREPQFPFMAGQIPPAGHPPSMLSDQSYTCIKR
jgi:hypothetical protein